MHSNKIQHGYTQIKTIKTQLQLLICQMFKIIVYIARWTSVISEEVCGMGSYTTLAVQIALWQSVISFTKITYHTAKIFRDFPCFYFMSF